MVTVTTNRSSRRGGESRAVSKYIVFRQALASLADNFSAPYIGYYLASLTPSGIGQGVLQFSINALPTLAQVFVGPFIDRYRRYVLALLISSTIASLMWIAISLIVEPFVFIALVTIRAIFVGLTGLAFTAFIGILYSHVERGRILSRVNVASQIATLIVLTITAFVINPPVEMLKYLFLFSGMVSFVASLLWIKIIYLDRSFVSAGQSEISLRSTISDIRRNRVFIKLTLLYSSHIMTLAIAWPWFPIAQRYILNMSVAEVAILNIYSVASTMISQYTLMHYLHKLNLRRLLIASRLGFIIPPLFYSFAQDVTTVYVASILLSPFLAISNVAIPLYVLKISPYRMYASYTAFLNFFQGILAAVGSIIGGFIADVITKGGSFDNLRYVLIIDAGARFVTALLFTKIDDV